MSNTRFSNDPARIQKSLEQSTYSGRYALLVPGPGDNLPFLEDPHMRMQTWGANLHTGFVDLDSEMRGIGRPLTHAPSEHTLMNSWKQVSTQNTYGSLQPFVEETRASHPAWTFREQSMNRWEEPWLNPQAKEATEKKFLDNVQTRILEKDRFHRDMMAPFEPVHSVHPLDAHP